jgi:hypothetical protein
VTTILARCPGSVTVQPAQRIRAALLSTSALSTILALVAYTIPDDTGARPIPVEVTTFAVVSWISVWLKADLFPTTGLTLGPNGFEFALWRLRTAYEWRDVENFRIIHDGDKHIVVFDRVSTDGNPRQQAYDDRLPELYGLAPESLTAVLQSWREAALAPLERQPA